MEVLYSDLENYDDVDTVDRLRCENSELKLKLADCNRSMELLQKSILQDFDKLEAEFKQLETNYSSLLKISRAEIQRKTQMITALNIEKDNIIINAAQQGQRLPPIKLQNIVQTAQTEGKRKKKNRKKAGGGPKEEFKRRECDRPPSSGASSPATDSANKMVANERGIDTKPCRVAKQVEPKQEVFPDHRDVGNRSPIADKRIAALSRHQFSKLSSDEEFEDLYSALKPEPNRQPERNRKRAREVPQEQRNRSNDRSHFPDPFRDRFNRNRPTNRDKQYNDLDRNMPRDRQFNDRNTGDRYDSNYTRFSPERHHRGGLGDDHFTQCDRNRRLESPPRERPRSPPRERPRSPPRERPRSPLRERPRSPPRERPRSPPRERPRSPPRERHRVGSPPLEKPRYRIPKRRKSFHDSRFREEEHQKMHKEDRYRHNYPETHPIRPNIHGEYDEPKNKKPRIEPVPYHHREDRRPSEKQYNKDSHLLDTAGPSCQSPDFSHTEESSNEHVMEIRSTASTVLEDPRINSKKYIISNEGSKDVLQSVNANNIHMQPVNKSLWNLQQVEVPMALPKPSEICEELVETDLDKPLSVISMESGEIESESTDMMDEVSDFREHNQRTFRRVSNTIYNRRMEKKRQNDKLATGFLRDLVENDKNQHIARSPIANITSKITEFNSGSLEKETKRNKEKTNIDNNTMLKDSGFKRHISEKDVKKHKEKPPMDIDMTRASILKSDVLEKETIHHIEKSPIDNSMSKGTGSKNDENEKEKSAAYNITSNPTHFKNDALHSEIKQHIDKSTVDSNAFKDVGFKSNVSEDTKPTRRKSVKSEKANNRRTEEPSTSKEIRKDRQSENSKLPNILQKLTESVGNQSPEPEKTVKLPKSKEVREIKPVAEPKPSHKTVKEMTRMMEDTEHKKIPELNALEEPEQEAETSVAIIRDFEHRVYSRHIVESDLELSDESNDETALKIDVKVEVNNKPGTVVKSHQDITNEKVESVDTRKNVEPVDTRMKTRSKKNKEKDGKSTNKFSDLFGDSSSLITPEDLNIATRTAQSLPAECCPPAIEDAQDAIIDRGDLVQTSNTNLNSKTVLETMVDPLIVEDKKTKATKNSSKHKRRKDSDRELISEAKQKGSGDNAFSELKKQDVNSTPISSNSEIKLLLSQEKLQQLKNAKINSEATSYIQKLNEKVNESEKSNNRPKNKAEKKLTPTEPLEDSNTNMIYSTLEPASNKKLTLSDDKENASDSNKSVQNVSSEMPKIFDDFFAKMTSPIVAKVDNERVQESINRSREAEDVPNLAPVTEEPGLVKMVVISSGTQPLNTNPVQYITPVNALASSTPAKGLPALNTSETEPNTTQSSAQVSVTIAREGSVSQSDTDVPDMKITCYRRRRKVLKR